MTGFLRSSDPKSVLSFPASGRLVPGRMEKSFGSVYAVILEEIKMTEKK